MRAEQENLGRDETIAFETRYMRWASNYGVETDSEEFLLHANLFLSFDMDRAKRAYFERAESAIDQAVQVEIEEVRDTGNQLFFDPRGLPIQLYGTRMFDPNKPGTSSSSEPAPALAPDKLVEKLESSEMGCVWMLEELEGLLERARSRFWTGGDRLRMIRLLGRNPAHSIDDWRVAEVFAASYAIHPVGEPFDELECDMGGWRLPKYVKEVHAMWPDLSREDDPEKARQSLVDIVQTEIERIQAIAQEHKQNAGEEAARIRALKAFDVSPTAETIRKSFIRAKSSVERGIAVIRKETKARKADRDGQGLPPVPGKDISPYDGRPAAWWRESVGERKAGRRAGIRAEGGGRRAEDENQCGGRGQEAGARTCG